ncbi:MAG TPA: hypothetical protein VK206_11220, partial [Anaerolineales bacterium]|nr:hypothetical protein [Anaerolineales bacterium]
MPTILVSARKPFNFISVLNSHGWRQLAPFSYAENTNVLSYILRLSNGRVIELKLRDGMDGIVVETEKLNKAERKEVVDKVTWMFGLDMDFSLFYTASRAEPKLAHAKKLARGRVLRSPTLFEDVIKTILTTNTLWGATKNMTLKLVNEFGVALTSYPLGSGAADEVEAPVKKAFPTPEAIATSSPEFLKEK